jgi:hypothetical protein
MPDEREDPMRQDADPAEQDERWRRVVGELRREPRVRPEALDAVMAEVLASPVVVPGSATRPRRDAGRRDPLGWLVRPRMVAVSPLQAVAATLLVAVALGAALARGGGDGAASPARSVAATPTGAAGVQAASHEAASRTVQFVFVSGAAHEVSLVGDFNDWQTGSTPLRRVSPDGLWAVEVPLEPGRYTYAFVVDGTRWVPDETAPRAPDDEFGGEKSVVYVRQDT